MRAIAKLLATTLVLIPAIAPGSETISYSYDAKGRVVAATHSGSVNSNVQSTYTHDKADNRTHLTDGVLAASPPSFAIAAASAVTEGGALAFTVTKTGATSATFSVNYATSGGTATSGADYNSASASGTLTFLASDTSKTASITTIDDAAAESAETVQVTLSGATGGATISTASASGTINDNDTAPNTPPSAVADSMTVAHCGVGFKAVTANDTDADGDYPLSVTAVSGTGAPFASIASASTIQFDAPSAAGSYPITYTVTDSRGATATATLSVTVTGSGACP